MQKQLKRLGKYFFLSGAMLFLGCQNDDTSSTATAGSKSKNIKTISIDQLKPKIINEGILLEKLSRDFKKKNYRHTENGYAFDLDSIKQFQNGDYSSYTVSAEKIVPDSSNYIYKLLIEENQDTIMTSMLTFDWKEGNLIPIVKQDFTSDTPAKLECITVTIVTDCTCHTHGTATCTHQTYTTVSTCSGGSPGSGVGGIGGTPITTPTNPGGGGGNPVVVIDQEDAWIRFNSFKSRLSIPQKNWLNSHPDEQGEIFAYLWGKGFSGSSQATVKNLLNAAISGDEVDFTYRIIKDESFKNNPCLNSVYTQLGGASTFQNYLKNFDGNFSVANLKLRASNSLANDTNAETSSPDNYLITITFNQNKLNRPSLDIARTFIHELIHAEMYRKLMSLAGQPNVTFTPALIQSMKNNYPGLYDYYIRYQSNISPGQIISSAQHEAMAQHYRSIIVQALKQFDSSQQENVYQALAWIGLMGSGALNPSTGLPSNPTVAWQNLPQSQRLQIITTYTNFYNSNTPCQQ